MHSGSRMIAFAAVGVLGLLCAAPAIAQGQGIPQVQAVTHLASLAPGAIQGIVQDEKGAPVVGAMVSALGTSTAFAMTDRGGRFEMRTLSPGPYLIRAHLAGFIASRGQLVDVRPSTRVSSSIALRRVAGGVRRTIAATAALAFCAVGALLLAFPRVMSILLAGGAFVVALGLGVYALERRRAQDADDGV